MDPDKPTSPDNEDPNWRTAHRPDLFNRITANYSMDLSQSPTSSQLYPYHQQPFVHSAFSPPPISPSTRQYRSMSNLTDPLPPLPPKPILYPTMDINTYREDYQVSPSPPPPPPLPPLPSSSSLPPPLPSSPLLTLPPPPPPPPQNEVIDTVHTEDSDELAMVLALSQSESVQKRLLDEQLINQEEEDLARALAASLLPGESYFPSLNDLTNAKSESNNTLDTPCSSSRMPLPLTPSDLTDESSDPHDTYAEFGRYDKWRIPKRPEKQQEAAPKTLESQSSPSFSSVSLLPYSAPAIDADKSSSGHLTIGDADEPYSPETVLQFDDDKAHSRQLASNEEKILKQLNQSLYNQAGQQDGFVDQAKSSPISHGKQNTDGRRPQPISLEEPYSRQYPQDASGTTPSTSVPTFSTTSQSTFGPAPVPDYSFPSIGRANSYQRDIYQETRKSSLPFSPIAYPSLGSRRGSASDVHSETSQTSLPLDDKSDVPLRRPATSQARQHSKTLLQPIATTSATNLNQSRPSSTGLLNVNQFVDHDLLRGVSIGFKSPMISPRLVPMQDQMPNIISLPYTRCPPLHIQAPDWRHLLRLMARLSGTRIEPTVEATTVSKVEVKLRTVIQFVKPHPSSNDWRSVLWFTIDQPVPSSVPSASRYTSGNPNLLPWSYTISPVPVLLRDASDTHMSKTYTIPATDTIPLPTLPITFPDLALYLQAALDTSRRHLSDSPNGLGKLGKMVQTCYPNINQDHSEYDAGPERTKVSQYFKRVIGLSNKDKKKVKGTNNEETYQLVTPFIPNEWG